MSFDRQLDQVCPHVVHEELLFTQDDLRSVRPLRPIASSSSVRVWVNGQANPVPSFGALLPPVAHGNRVGPFTYPTGTLSFQLNSDPYQGVLFPASTGQPAQRVADWFNRQAKGVRMGVTRNGRLTLTSDFPGKEATLWLAPSALATTFGLPTLRQLRGQTLHPGWTLVRDPLTLDDRPTRLIIFDQPLSAYINHIEVSYSTIQQECRRCGGTGYEYDWRLTRKGNYVEVRDESLITQEVLKDLLTVKGSNPFHPWYGSGLVERIGSKIVDGSLLQNLIASDVSQTLNLWQTIKREQEKVQRLSDEEYPYRLLSCKARQDTEDPTVVYVEVIIQNRSLQPVVLERGFRIPDTSGLLLSAGGPLRQSLLSPTLVA